MAYLGVRESEIGRTIEVKLHGPYKTTYGFDIRKFQERVKALIDANASPDPNILCMKLAQLAIDEYGDDVYITWAECEVKTSDGLSFGAAAVPRGSAELYE